MNSTVLNYPETVPVSAPGRGERTKGGEKTKSEWEELEKLTKDELIIELVRARVCYRNLREKVEDECIWPLPDGLRFGDARDGHEPENEKTTREWAEKIAQYGAMHPKDGLFCWCDLMDYGLDEDQCFDVTESLLRNGSLKVPEGTDIDWDNLNGAEPKEDA